MADYIAKVNPRYFAAAQLFAAQNDIRYYLNGVCIEPHPEGGAILVATDGHTLAAIHDPEGFARETIIVGGITKGLISACKTKGNPLAFTRPEQLLIGKTCAVVTGHKSQEPEPDPFDPLTLHASKIELIDGKFPDWRRVMPADRKGDSARLPAVNVRYLGRLSEAFSILRPGKRGEGYALYAHAVESEGCPVTFRFSDVELVDRFVALIMPIRDMGGMQAVPEWLRPKAKPRLRFRGEVMLIDGDDVSAGAARHG